MINTNMWCVIVGVEEDRGHKEEGEGHNGGEAAQPGAAEDQGAARPGEGTGRAHARREKPKHEKPNQRNDIAIKGVAIKETYRWSRKIEIGKERIIRALKYVKTAGVLEECEYEVDDKELGAGDRGEKAPRASREKGKDKAGTATENHSREPEKTADWGKIIKDLLIIL